MQKLRERLRQMLTAPVMADTERAELGAALDAAQNFDDLAIVSGRMMNVGARELGKVANGLDSVDRVEAARVRADAARSRVPELDNETEPTK